MRRVGRAAAGHTTLCLNRSPVDTRLFRSSSDGLARCVTGEERDRVAGGLMDTLIIEVEAQATSRGWPNRWSDHGSLG